MKCWDLGGQSQYRAEWGRFEILSKFCVFFVILTAACARRYTRGCDVVIFVVDTNAMHLLPDAKAELHRLLEDRELSNTALLVVANKIDLEPHATEAQLIKGVYA